MCNLDNEDVVTSELLWDFISVSHIVYTWLVFHLAILVLIVNSGRHIQTVDEFCAFFSFAVDLSLLSSYPCTQYSLL